MSKYTGKGLRAQVSQSNRVSTKLTKAEEERIEIWLAYLIKTYGKEIR